MNQVVAIPAFLIWKVRFGTKPKIRLGLFLCLQVVMAIVALVRVSRIVLDSTFDVVWVILWQLIEAYVAIITVSLTAFQSVFVSDGTQRSPASQKTWLSTR